MRLSTSMLYELGYAGIQREQSAQVELQQKISLGRRVLKPSDDPIAAAAVIAINQAQGLNTQYGENAADAYAALALEEQALSDAARLVQDVKTLSVKAGNPSLQNEDRASIATELRGLYGELLGIANRTDSRGQYLFSGYQGSVIPFAETAPGVVAYAGDEGTRMVQVGPQRRIPVGDSGAEVFQRMREGNGTFVAEPASGNSGSGVAGAGAVLNPQAWASTSNSANYTVRFHVSNAVPPVTTYDIVDNVANVSKLTGAAPAAGPHARIYESGVPVLLRRLPSDPSVAPFDTGVQVDITGAPANGDTFIVRRAAAKDVFETVHDLITTLETGISGSIPSQTGYQNGLNAGSSSLDRALDHVLTALAATGSRMKELDSLAETTADVALHHQAERSRIQDLDYAQALSDLSRRQFNLEAAQKSFVAITRLKLFDFL